MDPVEFKESTKVLTRPEGMTDQECGPLHVWSDGSQTVSLWRPTWRERLSILLFGRVWLAVLFGETQPPVSIEGRRVYFKTVEVNHE